MTREERLSRDISAIKKSLQSIAEDLRYFRKKDEAAAAVEEEEPKYTCKNCAAYTFVDNTDSTAPMHWCTVHICPISEDGLKDICDSFVKDGDF